jgi:hypothetical protein
MKIISNFILFSNFLAKLVSITLSFTDFDPKHRKNLEEENFCWKYTVLYQWMLTFLLTFQNISNVNEKMWAFIVWA